MSHGFQIGDYILVPSLNQLHHIDQVYTLEPKVIDLLLFFAHQPNIIASREEIRHAIWGKTLVSDHAINRLVSQLRKALSDNKQPYQYIETVAKRGYRLVANVTLATEKKRYQKGHNKALRQHKYLWIIITIITMCTVYGFKDELFSSGSALKINGGTIKQISAIPGREWLPKYSSNGQWLTFLHFDKVTKRFHIMLKTDEQELAKSAYTTQKRISDYYWLPHQDRLIVATFDGEHCLIEQLEISKPYSAFDTTAFGIPCGNTAARSIAWSQADDKLYWIADSGELHQQKIDTHQLPFTSLDLAAVEKVPLVNNIYQLVLSLNGKHLALLKHHQWERSAIELYNVENNQLQTIYKSQSLIHALSWDNAGEHLVFVEGNSINTVTLQGELNVAGFNSENDIYNIHYNAERAELLYASSNAKYQLIKLTKQTGGGYHEKRPQWRSQMNERNPVYSHDGESLAFISQRAGQYGIAIKQDDSSVRQLKLHDLDLSQTLIRWSPDDQKLLFHSEKSLFIYSLVTDKYKKVTADNIYADVVAWSYRMPENIYFRSDLDGQMNIWLVNIYSGNISKLTEKGGFSGHESEDGQYFYYGKEVEDGLWRLNLTTNEEVLVLKGFSRENHLSWYLVDQGIYYLYSREHVPSIYYYSFDSKSEQLLWPYKPWTHGGFTISSDQKNIVLGLKEQIEWNIMSIGVNKSGW